MFIALISILSCMLFAQDRTYLFYASPSGSGDGWEISTGNSFSEKFPVSIPLYDDYFLERIHIYYIMESEEANVIVNIRHDNDNSPGGVVEGAEWSINLVSHGGLSTVEEHIFYTTSDCILLEKDNYYWISLQAEDETSQIKWAHSSSSYYDYSISHDEGMSWSPTETGTGAAGKISAEAVYHPPEIDYGSAGAGDVNLDGTLNVLDVVSLAGNILGTVEFTDEQSANADFNSDGEINILDVVGLVNEILNPTIFTWTLEDINPSSDSYEAMIGPPVFVATDKVSGYYFGKAG